LFYLYQKLIFPVEKYFTSENLCIIPDEKLYSLSFENLISKFTEKTFFEYGKSEYLINKYNITYHFSSYLKNFNYSSKSNPVKQILAVAPDYNFLKNKNMDSNNLFRDLKSFAFLTGIGIEVRKINEITKADTLIGMYITKNIFKQKASDYEIIHLATHSFADIENPESSGLIFGFDTIQNQIDILRNYEIRNLNLNCNLLVLSGCNTGIGEIISGEGVLSIARNFYIAGSSTIITSLWNVSDISTCEIMTYFYQFLNDGYSASESLKMAKLEYLKFSDPDGSNPIFWSGLVLIGDENYIMNKSDNVLNTKYFYILGISLVAFFLCFIIFKKKKIKS
jgi:CHAT domain-containing protein